MHAQAHAWWKKKYPKKRAEIEPIRKAKLEFFARTFEPFFFFFFYSLSGVSIKYSFTWNVWVFSACYLYTWNAFDPISTNLPLYFFFFSFVEFCGHHKAIYITCIVSLETSKMDSDFVHHSSTVLRVHVFFFFSFHVSWCEFVGSLNYFYYYFFCVDRKNRSKKKNMQWKLFSIFPIQWLLCASFATISANFHWICFLFGFDPDPFTNLIMMVKRLTEIGISLNLIRFGNK